MLVVDDNEVIRQLIAVNLELEGFEVHLAEDGVDCLARLDAVQPDAITLDVVMPRLDGFATLARLRGAAATRTLPGRGAAGWSWLRVTFRRAHRTRVVPGRCRGSAGQAAPGI